MRGHETPEPSGEGPTRIVLVLADDQRTGLEWAMPELTKAFFPAARAFERTYVTAPLCCPMRASLLSGGFPLRDTRVTANELPNGGAARFEDGDTLATRLQAAGVTTGLFGNT